MYIVCNIIFPNFYRLYSINDTVFYFYFTKLLVTGKSLSLIDIIMRFFPPKVYVNIKTLCEEIHILKEYMNLHILKEYM